MYYLKMVNGVQLYSISLYLHVDSVQCALKRLPFTHSATHSNTNDQWDGARCYTGPTGIQLGITALPKGTWAADSQSRIQTAN